ncbi:MAG: sugar phosphate isomerase/epimerase family protein [Candidatus Bathyarchaeia archaeon]
MSKLYVQPIYHDSLPEFIGLAEMNGYNLELATFAFANIYDTDWNQVLKEHQQQLKDFQGQISMHGVYNDVRIHSEDAQIAMVSQERIQSSINVAKSLNAQKIVFHGAINPLILNEWYLKNWLDKNTVFWKQVLEQYTGVVLIENVWEPSPDVFRKLLDMVDSNRFKVCLDVAHAHVCSKVPLDDWLATLGDDVVYMHFSDNNGKVDQHAEIGTGNIDWQSLTQNIHKLGLAPEVVLEECTLNQTQASINYLEKHQIYPY